MIDQTNSGMMTADVYFGSPVYFVEKPEFLQTANQVADQYLASSREQRGIDSVYPLVQSDTLHMDPRLDGLMMYIASSSWDILYDQGYDMDHFYTTVNELWAQEHHHLSGHNEHVHGFGSQITGFYFLDAPDDCSKIVIHDPRPAKKQINLPQRSLNDVTLGSLAINFTPKKGLLVLMNSYVPHEFTRNQSKSALKFIHFNVSVMLKSTQPNSCAIPQVEII